MCEVLLSLASTLIDLGVLANNAARALLLSSLVKSDNNMASAEDGITASAVLPVTDCQVGYRDTKSLFIFSCSYFIRALELSCCKAKGQETDLENRRCLKVLNDTQLLLNQAHLWLSKLGV